jgi:hypothetical protein
VSYPRPIEEPEAREIATEIGNAVKLHDLNDDETIELIALTVMVVSGGIGRWENDGRLRDLFLKAKHRHEKAMVTP